MHTPSTCTEFAITAREYGHTTERTRRQLHTDATREMTMRENVIEYLLAKKKYAITYILIDPTHVYSIDVQPAPVCSNRPDFACHAAAAGSALNTMHTRTHHTRRLLCSAMTATAPNN